ncbi:hypothetical protein [Lysobacter sp. H21R4]|uniref:hypothetical protein n=1 Tax=Lysobacter sp. H21R4 TaxID=2781021 RepID=UPI001E4C57F3|nr:hypothetical protein [Lysobacter sp. H21R4]
MRRLYSNLITTGFGLGLLLMASPAVAAEPQAGAGVVESALRAPAAHNAAPAPRPAARGMTEIPDPELATMRGRYTVGDHQVAWFGVSMISSWQTASGQTLEGTLMLGMDFAQGGRPRISFTPTVNITASDAPVTGDEGIVRSVDGAGLANVSGMTQSVQVAGDGNSAANVTRLNVRDGSAPVSSDSATASAHGSATAHAGGATASASFDGSTANVMLQIQGEGAVEQWIRNGSLGQSIQLTSDHQQVSNRMEIDLVRHPLAANAQLAQNVAQAIQLTRGIGPGGY